MWEILVFVLNAVLFMLVGLQLPGVIDGISGMSTGTIVAVRGRGLAPRSSSSRFLWVFPSTYLPRLFSRRVRERDPPLHWHFPAIVAWTGMRGAVSLAAALAIPHDDRRRRRLPPARPHHLPHLRGDRGHADPAGDDAAHAHPRARASGGRATERASPRRACSPPRRPSIGIEELRDADWLRP